MLESMVGPREIAATARRHGIARSQLLAWRRAMEAGAVLAMPGFVPAVIASEPAAAPPASALPPARIEIVLRSGNRIILEGAVDTDAVLKLARGLEALP